MDKLSPLTFAQLFERIQAYAQRVDLARPRLSVSLSNGQTFEGVLDDFYHQSEEAYVLIRGIKNTLSWIKLSSIVAVSVDNLDHFSYLFQETTVPVFIEPVSSLTFQRRIQALTALLSTFFSKNINVNARFEQLDNEQLGTLHGFTIILENTLKALASEDIGKQAFTEQVNIIELSIGTTTQFNLKAKTLALQIAQPLQPQNIEMERLHKALEQLL
jgi:hypothetical protein